MFWKIRRAHRKVWFIAGMACAMSVGASAAVKTLHIKENKPTCEIDLAYPATGTPAIDQGVAEWTQDLATRVRAECAEASKDPSELGPGGKYTAELSFSIIRDDNTAFSVTYDLYSYSGGAHPITEQFGQTLLKPDGQRVYIAELIGPAGLKQLSAFAIRDLKTQWRKEPPSDDETLKSGAGPAAPNFESFAWKPNGDLLILFSPYQVAPYAAGPQKVTVPAKVAKTWLRPDLRAPMPSIDCAKGVTAIEKATCKDWRLARADRQMAEDYAEALKLAFEPEKRQKVISVQRAWLKSRDTTCASVPAPSMANCLTPLIESRRKALAEREH